MLNNLYKRTQLQDIFGVNMLALVDGVPRALNLAQVISDYIDHQVEVVTRRTEFRLRKAEERAHVLEGLLIALDNIDEVIALIRSGERRRRSAGGLDGEASRCPRSRPTRSSTCSCAASPLSSGQKIQDEYEELQATIAESQGDPGRPRSACARSSRKSSRRSRQVREPATHESPDEGEFDIEDLIADEDVVLT